MSSLYKFCKTICNLIYVIKTHIVAYPPEKVHILGEIKRKLTTDSIKMIEVLSKWRLFERLLI